MNATATTARRARALAGALNAVTVTPEQRTARTELIRSLRDVALALVVLPAEPADGPQIPAVIRDELTRVLPLLGPSSGIPAHVMTYVLEPLTGRTPELPTLDASSYVLALQEVRIKDRMAIVRGLLDSEHESILRASFLSLIALHRQLLDLGAAVGVSNALVCHQ